jgi:SAM-dependent methyltransferase
MNYQAVPGHYVDEIAKQRRMWEQKPVLRDLYARYFDRVRTNLASGEPTVEIGGGSGRLKQELSQEIVSSDVFRTPWVDIQLDAHHFPFQEATLRNVIAIDVLHHLPDPLCFFRECVRVLSSGGRIVLIEPHISLWSFFVYRFLHHEQCDLTDDAWGPRRSVKDYNFANAALPWLILQRCQKRFLAEFPELRILDTEYLDFIAYPASGGFNYRSFAPMSVIRAILKFEKLLPKTVTKYITGMRSTIVIERI